jgi:methyltransferase (TIGR00027 family)
MHTSQSPAISWQYDLDNRINPKLISSLMRQAVPVLEHCDWRVVKVEPGMAETILPLNAQNTNQHGTHQGALISLSADYTGGMALVTLLTGVPVAGIHKSDPKSASLWLASMELKFIRPSTGHLIGRCQISEKDIEKIQSRYFAGKRVLIPLDCTFESNGEKIAEAKMKYFVQPTEQLLQNNTTSTLFQQKLKASARMIAGVRASEHMVFPSTTGDPADARKIRIDYPMAELAAGPHGMLLADKLTTALPQLTNMVLARTQHADQTIRSIKDLRQIVLVGAGLDLRPFRHFHENLVSFELDLPDMLIEREKVIKNNPSLPKLKRVPISADFLRDDVQHCLKNNKDFDPTLPTAFIYEGCSMYFDEEINQQILGGLKSLMKHPSSVLWADFVDRQVVEEAPLTPEVGDFLQRMDDLGESFIFGSDQPDKFLQGCGFGETQFQSVLEYLGDPIKGTQDEGVYAVYYFATAKNSS